MPVAFKKVSPTFPVVVFFNVALSAVVYICSQKDKSAYLYC